MSLLLQLQRSWKEHCCLSLAVSGIKFTTSLNGNAEEKIKSIDAISDPKISAHNQSGGPWELPDWLRHLQPLGWETLQKNQADNRTTQKRQCWLVTHCTRDYSYLKILTRALLVLCDKEVITEWPGKPTIWLKLAEILGINQCSSHINTTLETQQDTAISPVFQLSSHCLWLKQST